MSALLAALVLAACGGSGGTGGGGPAPTASPRHRAVTASGPETQAHGGPPSSQAGRSVSISAIDHGPRSRRWVALTFDADMTQVMLARLHSGLQRTWYDAGIVHELEATHTPATIFLTGLWTEAYPAVVRRLAHNRLFELENHSVDHSGWLAPCYGLRIVRGALSKREEIRRAADQIQATAHLRPRFFRFPGGCHAAADLRLVAAAGERAVGWDVVSGDAFQPDSGPVVRAVLGGVRPGSIVIMHIIGAPNAPATERALPTIIGHLRARGYRFVTVRKLLSS